VRYKGEKVNYNYTKFEGDSEPQPMKPKKTAKPLIAAKTCTVEFENCTVDLVKGREVHGLKREERDYLKYHGFVE